MRRINARAVQDICGGFYFIWYPLAGCAANTAMNYIDNPNMTCRDAGNSCARGAVHGLNPGFNIIGSVISNPIARYVVGMAYARYATRVADRIVPGEIDGNNLHTCPVFLGGESD